MANTKIILAICLIITALTSVISQETTADAEVTTRTAPSDHTQQPSLSGSEAVIYRQGACVATLLLLLSAVIFVR